MVQSRQTEKEIDDGWLRKVHKLLQSAAITHE